jgi:hypothetical protein
MERSRKEWAKMTVTRDRFLAEAARTGIDESAALALYERIYPAAEPASALSRDGTPLMSQSGLSRTVQALVGLGVVLVIGAHAWWSTTGYESLGIGLVLALTLVWQAGFLTATEWARRSGYGLLEAGFAAVVAFYTPLTIYSVERLVGAKFEGNNYSDFYPWISGGWVFMEVGSIAVAAALLWRYRRPFLLFPLTLFVGFLAMDATARILGNGLDDETTLSRVVLAAGIVLGLGATGLDYLGWRRFAFWPHLTSIWLVAWGLPFCTGSTSWSLFAVAAVDLLVGVWLARILYLAAGGVIGWAAISMSAHGAAFPFILMLGGVLFIITAIWLAKADSPLRRWLAERSLPAPQRDLAH